MFGVGAGEILLILIIILIFYGPDKLPEIAQKAGKLSRDFRRMTDEVKQTVEHELNRPLDTPENKEQKILPEKKDDNPA